MPHMQLYRKLPFRIWKTSILISLEFEFYPSLKPVFVLNRKWDNFNYPATLHLGKLISDCSDICLRDSWTPNRYLIQSTRWADGRVYVIYRQTEIKHRWIEEDIITPPFNSKVVGLLKTYSHTQACVLEFFNHGSQFYAAVSWYMWSWFRAFVHSHVAINNSVNLHTLEHVSIQAMCREH